VKIHTYHSYEELSAKAVEHVILLMSGYDKPLLCPASGDTPAGLYRELVERYDSGKFDVANWNFVGLDEWVGLNGSDKGSCRYSLDKELSHPLNIIEERIFFFDGRSANLLKECEYAEQFIREQRGSDVAILGLGMNGHIAMNEPGCTIDGRTQVVELHPITKQVGQKYFSQPKLLEEGLTLGMGTLLESKHIILMVSGKSKALIVSKMLEGSVTNDLPGSLLLNHPSVTVFLDEEAASFLVIKNLDGERSDYRG